MKKQLDVEVYSDYTCPWCYIGLERLEQLETELAGEIELRVQWRPFEIHAEVPPAGMPPSALGYPPDRWAAMVANLRRQAEAEGLEIAALERVANTHRALLAGAYAEAEEPERFEQFHRALFRAYFGEGRNIGDPAVIREVAGTAGIDVERMDAALQAGTYEDDLARTTADAGRYGITGTPTFVFGGRHGAVGAQPVAELKRVAERAIAAQAAEP